MPTSVFLSHSKEDKPFVRELADFLLKDPSDQIKIWLDERQITPGSNIVTKISDGLATSDFIILILSPASVNTNWVTEEWTDAFWLQTNQQQTKIIPVLYRDCMLPPLLRNKAYIDLRTNHLDGFRQIKTFLLTNQPVVPARHINQLPSRPPLFIGREPELAQLRQRLSVPGALVHIAEMAGKGKTSVAKEFAHRYQTDFESVYWLQCDSNSLTAIASDLERLLDLKLGADLETLVRDLKHRLSQKRCLLILDNVDGEAPGQLIPNGAASVLITTRRHDLRFLRLHPPLELPLFTEDQCFALFREALGADTIEGSETRCRQLFSRLGHLPNGVSIAAALIKEDVRCTIHSLAKNLPADVNELISQAVQALPESPRQMLTAMAACAPEGFSLSLAAQIAAFEEETAALDALQQLVARSLTEELSRPDRRYRLHTLVRGTACSPDLAPRHAEAVYSRFADWEANWRQCEKDLPDFELALIWALENHSNTAKNFDFADLGYCGYSLTRRIGRTAEAFDICKRMACFADEQKDDADRQAWLGNQSLILKDWGRLDEALSLLRKQQEICLALGNQNSLQNCYGNQAVILQSWGRLDEALAVHKKQEEICLALGNQDGLQRSYGNQALILKNWGRLDEALALQRKKEEICLALGNQNSLQMCYGNQAVILQAWGRLDEALALHKKEEGICLALGNQDSLQRSYGNQAVILRDWGQLDGALALLKKQEDICFSLGNQDGLQTSYSNQALILRAWGRLDEAFALLKEVEHICLVLGNQDGLQRCYGNQAIILKDWRRLDEAAALHKKREDICMALGNRSSLGMCYWGWGLLERALNHPQAEKEKLSAALAIFEELKMPRERDAVKAELEKSRAAGAS